MKKLTFLLTISFLTIISIVNAETKTEIDSQEINKECIAEPTPGELIETAFENFKAKKGIEFGADNNGKIYYAAKEIIAKLPTNSQWAKSRSFAFEKAFLKIQKDFVIDMFGNQTVKKVQEIFEDESDDAEEFPELDKSKSKLKSICDKLFALTGAKLDKALEKAGVDPEEYKALPPAQRKTTFMNKMTKTILTKAIGNMTGLIPIQTFEAKNKAGEHVIGVIGLYSPKLKQLAYDIAHDKEPLLKKKTGTPLKNIIPKDSKTLAKQFGIRCVFNENGEPCIISFGQWSHNYTGKDTRRLERKRESASENAFDEANAAITEFLSGRIQFEREREKGELIEDAMVKTPEGFIKRDNIEKIIDKMSSKLKLQAKADLKGITTIRKWKYKHPYGQEISGVVRVWTLAGAKTADKVRSWKADKKIETPKDQEEKNIKTKAGVETGKDFMNLDDF